MGVFGFACGRCWDKDCNCTAEELERYYIQCEINKNNIKEIEYSITEPRVCAGNVVFKNSNNYFIHKVVDGIAQMTILSDTGAGLILELEEPYHILISGTWK